MYLAIDYGEKRIGLALGKLIPKGAGVIDGTLDKEVILSEIEKICLDNEVEGIVIGWPKKPSGDDGEATGKIKLFGDSLKKRTSLPVFYEEEELTSVEAEKILHEIGQKYEKKDGRTDEMAAILILEQYLSNKDRTNRGM